MVFSLIFLFLNSHRVFSRIFSLSFIVTECPSPWLNEFGLAGILMGLPFNIQSPFDTLMVCGENEAMLMKLGAPQQNMVGNF